MMTRDEAIQKALKLLRLAEHPNSGVEEAAVAAARAQEILDRYELDRTLLELEGGPVEPHEDIVDFGDQGVFLDPVGHNYGTIWPVKLANALCAVNATYLYLAGGDRRSLALVGRPSEVAKVRYLFAYLSREVIRLSRCYSRGHYERRYGSSWSRNFMLGVVDTLATRLRQGHQAAADQVRAEAASTMALVKVDQALIKIEQRRDEVQRWVKTNLNLRPSRRVDVKRHYADARTLGRQAGEEIHLGGARAALGSGATATDLIKR